MLSRSRANGRKLRKAVLNGDFERVKMLAEKGADLTVSSEYGATAIKSAVAVNRPDIVVFLLDNGASLLGCLYAAIDRKNLEIAQICIDRNPEIVNADIYYGRTALHIAARNGYREGVIFLVKAGAKTEVKDREGLTALAAADKNGHRDIVQMLTPYMRKSVREAVKTLRDVSGEKLEEEQWSKLSDMRIARVHVDVDIGYRVTEIFNFQSGERTTLYRNLETGNEAVETKTFDDLAALAPLTEAFKQLKDRGGAAKVLALPHDKTGRKIIKHEGA